MKLTTIIIIALFLAACDSKIQSITTEQSTYLSSQSVDGSQLKFTIDEGNSISQQISPVKPRISFALGSTAPSYGSIQSFDATTGAFNYIAKTDASGASTAGVDDKFDVKMMVDNNSLESTTYMVNIHINHVNRAPVTTAQMLSTNENTQLVGALSATDLESDPLTYTILTNPAHGTIALSGKSFTYIPTQFYFGGDTFSFKANDGKLDSNVSSVQINVVHINQPPVAANLSISVNQGSQITSNVSASDVDTAQNLLKFSVVSQPANGSVSFSNQTSQFTYIPAANFSGNDSFTFMANDGMANSNIATVSIMVMAVATTGTATLAWDPNMETDLASYKIYYGTDSNNLGTVVSNVSLSSNTSFMINGLIKGMTYYFAVTAINTSGMESTKSNVASKVIN